MGAAARPGPSLRSRAPPRAPRAPQFLQRELGEDGYAGVEVRNTPLRTEIIIRATRTQNVVGEKGRRISELASVIQKRCARARPPSRRAQPQSR